MRGYEGPFESEPGIPGSGVYWIRKRWSLGGFGRHESVWLRRSESGWEMSWHRLAWLDEDLQVRRSSGKGLGLAFRWAASAISAMAYMRLAAWDREERIDPRSDWWHGRWPFAADWMPESRRARRIGELGL